MNELLVNLIAHMRWADAAFADALARASTPDSGAVLLLAHIASVENLWYSRVCGQPALHAVWPTLTVSDARALASEHADRFEELVRSGDDVALARTVRYTNSAGRSYENSIGDIVTHVAMHGSHHRGQLARMLREAGAEPPYTDYIQFARRAQTG